MPKYYSLMLSPNISKTVHGYLICENVPICRSGFQEYKGSELVGFPGYEESWGLEPDTRYKVYRPKESVLDPEFIKSIEGNSVVDEHPDGSVVHVDNDQELNCGHIEKVGKGIDLPDGEVTLKGDLFIKNPDLIDKIRPEGDPDGPYAVRDVSLGYSLKLKRLDDGTLVMYHLRGNHVAVVEKGRAGSLIAIKDSAIVEEIIEVIIPPVLPEINNKREKYMSMRDLIFGRGIKVLVPDATPEEIAQFNKELNPSPAAVVKLVTDAEPEPHAEHMGALKEYCDKGGDKAKLMSFLKGEHMGDEKSDETLEELEEEEGDKPGKTAGEEHQDEKTPAEEKEEMNDADEINDPGESVLKQANDSVRSYLKLQKPVVAAIIAKPKTKRSAIEQTMVDSYNNAIKGLNNAGGRAYRRLSITKVPEHIIADAAVTKVETACNCFDGVPYRIGLKKHEAHLAQKGK